MSCTASVATGKSDFPPASVVHRMTEVRLNRSLDQGDQRGLLRHIRRRCFTLARHQIFPALVLGSLLVALRITAGHVVHVGHFGTKTELEVDTRVSLTSNTIKQLYLHARADVVDVLDDGDTTCENWRRWKEQQCAQAATCGKGWLLRQQGLVVVMPGVYDGSLARDWRAGESRIVKILGLKDQDDQCETREVSGVEQADCEGSNLSMLVRLQGPEALAEAASPVKGQCAWTVELKPSFAGNYTLDVTLIEWKGFLEPHREMCNSVLGAYGEGSVRMDNVPKSGGPFYGAHEGCCSLCTRLEGCVAWSATDRPDVFLIEGDSRCVMYSSVVGKPLRTKEQQEVWSGTPRGEEAMTYLGSSMNMRRSWCAQRNAAVFGSGVELTVMPAEDATINGRHDGDQQDLPLCRGHLQHEGRWVRLDLDICQTERWKGTLDGWPNYDIHRFGTEVPEECYFARGRVMAPATQPNALSDPDAVPEGYVFQPYECRYDVMKTPDRMRCLADRNVTRFLDFGDSLVETSRASRTSLFLPEKPSHWSTGSGRLQTATGAEQQGCSGPNTKYYGHDDKSNTHYCGMECWWQSPVDILQKLIVQFSPDVVLANWSLVHRLWHASQDEIEKFLADVAKSLDDLEASTGATGAHPRYKFWLPLPFLVGEREPHCVLGRSDRLNAGLRRVLQPRGWIEVDWQAMTKKWALDIPDGMHHGAQPTRMLAYLLMHHICHGDGD